jgi:hypothetical protein
MDFKAADFVCHYQLKLGELAMLYFTIILIILMCFQSPMAADTWNPQDDLTVRSGNSARKEVILHSQTFPDSDRKEPRKGFQYLKLV